MSQEEAPNAPKPRCGLCGSSSKKLTRTPCCENWICDDEEDYVPFSYSRVSCYRNHLMQTVCGAHFNQQHKGRWQDCAKCREQPLELYVHAATNEYNFEKLENPPDYEPTYCSRCGVIVRLASDGYSYSSEGFTCLACSNSNSSGGRDLLQQLRENQAGPREVRYPIGTLGFYGPTNKLATKIVASIMKGPDLEPNPLHRWVTQVGDIRDDERIWKEVMAFFRKHRVTEVASLQQIMGCPHEEGKDYPLGGQCPHCPFWHDLDRLSLQPISPGGMSAVEILRELSDPAPKHQPLEALAAAEHHREALTEPLLRALERGIAAPRDTPAGESMLFSYASYLLSKWREKRAYPLFVQWLSLPEDQAFDIGGDAPTEHGPVFLASVCGGDIESIKQLILNRTANVYCRSQAIIALAVLVAWKELPHKVVSDLYLWLLEDGIEKENTDLRDQIAHCCADIEALDVFPTIRKIYNEDSNWGDSYILNEIELAEHSPRGDSLATFRERHPPITDVAEATGWWQCFKQDVRKRYKSDSLMAGIYQDQSIPSTVPYRAAPKIGRNDPCPCGSGKKYKKCCGAS